MLTTYNMNIYGYDSIKYEYIYLHDFILKVFDLHSFNEYMIKIFLSDEWETMVV